MRSWMCVPMMALCMLLCGCGGGSGTADREEHAREPYQAMESCAMEAEVTCGVGTEELLTFTLRCDYIPDGVSTVEILAPETAAGIRAELDGESMRLVYEDAVLNTETLSTEGLSPAVCLPVLMDALRDGWLLEENEEKLEETPCLRLCMDQTGKSGGKIFSTVWLRQEDGVPVYGEISVDDEIILQARFTEFQFGDILTDNSEG